MLQRSCEIIFSIKFNLKTTLILPVRNVVFLIMDFQKMLLSDLTGKLKGAHHIPIPTPLTGILAFFMNRTPLFSLSRFPPPPPSLFAPATSVTLLLENANQEELRRGNV